MTLLVKADDNGIYLVANPIDLTGIQAEYESWLNESVIPTVMDKLTPVQMAIAAKYGLTQLKKPL